jgi:hypothetical protein
MCAGYQRNAWQSIKDRDLEAHFVGSGLMFLLLRRFSSYAGKSPALLAPRYHTAWKRRNSTPLEKHHPATATSFLISDNRDHRSNISLA